jgi:hypothetical protein
MKFFKKTKILLLAKTIIVLLNIVVLFYVYSFYKKNVYGSMVVDDNYLSEQSKQITNTINVQKFNLTLEKLSQKQKEKQDADIVNFFENK